LSYDNTTTPFYTVENPNTTSIKGNYNNKNNFIFGKFNKILRPFVRLSANEIKVTTNTDDTKLIESDIITKLKSGKPVCIVGYGRSGSGKTTSLIQSDVDNSSGILIQLVENLIQTGNGNYNKLEVTCREFMEQETTSNKYEEINIGLTLKNKTQFVDFL
jgi:ABC-type glutathione transport system ATPase component